MFRAALQMTAQPDCEHAAERGGGFELGAVQLMTLEKLEELYLYVIQINERIKTLEAENAFLKNK